MHFLWRVFHLAICPKGRSKVVSTVLVCPWEIVCGRSRIHHPTLISNTFYMEVWFGIWGATLGARLWNNVDLLPSQHLGALSGGTSGSEAVR